MYLWFSQMNFSVWVSEWCWHGWLMCVNKHHSHNSVFVAFLASFFCPPHPYSCTVPSANTSRCIHARQQHINARHLVLHWQFSLFWFTGVEWNLLHGFFRGTPLFAYVATWSRRCSLKPHLFSMKTVSGHNLFKQLMQNWTDQTCVCQQHVQESVWKIVCAANILSN